MTSESKSQTETPKQCSVCGDDLPDPIPVMEPRHTEPDRGYCSEECYNGD